MSEYHKYQIIRFIKYVISKWCTELAQSIAVGNPQWKTRDGDISSAVVNFSVAIISDLAKVPVKPTQGTYWISHSYLTGVAAVKLRRHLSDMIENFKIVDLCFGDSGKLWKWRNGANWHSESHPRFDYEGDIHRDVKIRAFYSLQMIDTYCILCIWIYGKWLIKTFKYLIKIMGCSTKITHCRVSYSDL